MSNVTYQNYFFEHEQLNLKYYLLDVGHWDETECIEKKMGLTEVWKEINLKGTLSTLRKGFTYIITPMLDPLPLFNTHTEFGPK